MDKKYLRLPLVTIIILTLSLMLGCTSTTPSPDSPTSITEDLSATDVIKTYQAELTQTAVVTALPSVTLPSASITPVAGTPLPTLTVSLPQSSDKAAWVYQTPVDGGEMGAGTKFDMIWTVENIGSSTWTRRFAVRYFSGWAMGEQNIFYLREEVAPGGQTNLVVDMVAPKDPGVYTTNWVLSNAEGVNFQVLTLTLKVVKGSTATPTGLPTPTFDPSSPPG